MTHRTRAFSLLSVFLILGGFWTVRFQGSHLVPSPAPASAAGCGDGILDEGEACDDGNTNDGDGCSGSCTVESGWIYTWIGGAEDSSIIGCNHNGVGISPEICWAEPANWLANAVPSDGANVDMSGTYANLPTIPFDTVLNLGTVTMGSNTLTDFGSINGGTFDGNVTDKGDDTGLGGNIGGGTFNGSVAVEGGTISGGTFNGSVTVSRNEWLGSATLSGGTFNGDVTINEGSWVVGGTFNGDVTINGAYFIGGGTFNGDVTINEGSGVYGGTFNGSVTVEEGGSIVVGWWDDLSLAGAGTIGGDVTVGGNERAGTLDLSGGLTITGTVTLNEGTITPATSCPEGKALSSITVDGTAYGMCVVQVCGNGTLNDGETCDDGNTDIMDGCSETCTVEEAWTCDNDPMPSVCTSLCGNGTLDEGEECDDGNTVDGDGCSLVMGLCRVAGDWSCEGEPSVCTPPCGNGFIESTEECDDANTTAGDGCSAACAIEAGYECLTPGSACTLLCGNSTLNEGETCDDGNTTDGDGCSAACAVESGYTCDTAVEPTTCTANETDAGGGAGQRNIRLQEWGLIPSFDGTAADLSVTDGGTANTDASLPAARATPPQATVVEPPQPMPVPGEAQGGGDAKSVSPDVPILPANASWYAPSLSDAVTDGLLPAASQKEPNAPVHLRAISQVLSGLSTATSTALQTRLQTRLQNLPATADTSLTRAAAIRLTLQSAGISIESGPVPFLDVYDFTPDKDAIATAARLGLVVGDRYENGQSRGTVRPNDPITWAEMSVILERLENHAAAY